MKWISVLFVGYLDDSAHFNLVSVCFSVGFNNEDETDACRHVINSLFKQNPLNQHPRWMYNVNQKAQRQKRKKKKTAFPLFERRKRKKVGHLFYCFLHVISFFFCYLRGLKSSNSKENHLRFFLSLFLPKLNKNVTENWK